jgi:hypothetical protein
MNKALILTLPFCACLMGCADIPALDGTISDAARNAPYPELTPIPPAPAPASVTEDTLAPRIAALQQRARALRAVDPGALQ